MASHLHILVHVHVCVAGAKGGAATRPPNPQKPCLNVSGEQGQDFLSMRRESIVNDRKIASWGYGPAEVGQNAMRN